MKPKKYKVMIDIYKGVLNNQLIEFTTQDHGSNVLEFEILEDKVTPYNLDGCLVRMVINGQQQDCTIADATNGLVNITLHQSMFSEVGPVFAELQIYDAVNQTIRLTTPIFKYTVRKSLMDDNTVQADPNYSILQNMILEVSSADEVAKQAKKTAESAMTTANKAESKANQIMANGDYAKEQGDYAKTQGDRLQGMLTLDGAPQTKFDFIENQVVQDGLVALPTTIQDTEENGIVFMCSFVYGGVPFELFTHLSEGNVSGWNLTMNPDSTLRLGIVIVSGTYTGLRGSKVLKNGEYYEIICLKNGTDYKVYINGTLEMYRQTTSVYSNIPYLTRHSSRFTNLLFYNRPLAPQEIQHNLSIFNNPPSIKELRTTDSEGKTSILKLASDEDHVEMSTGRTLREEYMGVLKTMGKDFTSSDGSPVEVNNGIEARVISGEIKGQTVKNYAKTIERSSFSSVTGQTKIDDMNNIITIDTPTEYSNCFLKKGAELLPNTKYKVVLIILENTLSGPFSINNGAHSGTVFAGSFDLPKGSTGVKEFMFTTKSDVSGDIILRMFAGVGSGRIKLQAMVVEENATTPTSYIPFGLSSTQTIISNNGQQYPIYANEEDKANKKVISLGGVGDVKDALEILEDGSGIWLNRLVRVVLNGSENWSIGNTGTQNYYYQCTLPFGTQSGGVSDKYSFVTIGQSDINQGFYITGNSLVRVRYGTEKPLNDFKQDLSTNNLTIICILATPIVTHIPKELVPAILTNQTNILDVGGAVKPSSFKVTVPVDRLAEIEARLQALESTTVDVVLNK